MNRHLNLFHFFNGNDGQYYEDNLSRAFALCLKHDGMFLDHVIRYVLGEESYNQNFSIDHPDQVIEIDLQINAKSLDGFRQIVGVACSAVEIQSFEEVLPRETDDPITDVCLKLNETCIIFEFKRTGEDCSAQLRGQVEKAKEACDGDVELNMVDLCWPKIVKIGLRALSVQKQLDNTNLFTNDFVNFLEARHPDWFPSRCLASIPFPWEDDDPNQHYLTSRLNQILSEAYGHESVVRKGGRFSIGIDYGWASEVQLRHGTPKEGDPFLLVQIWPGDTRDQGRALFKPGRQFEWPSQIEGYKFEVEPYLKFSHWTRGVSWVVPENDEQIRQTHCSEFFRDCTGRKKRENWPQFNERMEQIMPDWEKQYPGWGTPFEQAFEKSDRNYFDLSIGFALTVKIPYENARSMDNDLKITVLPDEVKRVVGALRICIDSM